MYMIIEIIRTLLGSLKRIPLFLSSFIPKDNKLFLFGAWYGYKYSDNTRALYEYINKTQQNINCIWITRSKEIYVQLQKEGYHVEYVNSIRGILSQLRAGVAFSCTGKNDFNSLLLGSCHHFELWHGVGGGKKIGFDDKNYCMIMDNRRCRFYRLLEKYPYRYSYYITTSEIMANVFKSAFRTDDHHLILAGQPRNDMFFDSEYEIVSFSPKIFAGKKVITYLPTHRLEGKEKIDCSRLFDFTVLNDFCKRNNCVFIIKKHFYHMHETEDVSAYSNIMDWTQESNIDTNELLMVSDYLVSDYSSVTADYLLLERPIFYYCYDLEKYIEKDRDMYWPYNQISPGPKCRTFSEMLKEMINMIENGNDRYYEERQRVLNMFYGQQARRMVSQDIIDAVGKILKEDEGKR